MLYVPISCDFYDELELRALRGKPVALHYQKADQEVRITAWIRTFETRNKEEFMQLENGEEIRLDRLISIDGIQQKGYCG